MLQRWKMEKLLKEMCKAYHLSLYHISTPVRAEKERQLYHDCRDEVLRRFQEKQP